MGLYDRVRVRGPQFTCSDGHDLSDEEFQSKDFGCTMGEVTIAADRVTSRAVLLGTPVADADKVEIYCTCTRCPAFVQFGTGNLVDCEVTFELEIAGDVVARIARTSPSTEDWLKTEPTHPWMQRCEGPMPYAEAIDLHRRYSELRPAHHAEFDRWRSARAQALQAGRRWPHTLQIGEYPDDAGGSPR